MREESRKAILSTSAALFAQKGFFNVRISDIARQAQMSPGNIYWYFTSKEEILKAILLGYFDAFETMLVQSEQEPGTPPERLLRLIDSQIDLLRDYGEYVNVFMSILGHGGPDFLKSIGIDTVEIGFRYHQHLRRILEAAIQNDFLLDQDPDMLAVLFFSFFNGLLITYGAEWQRVSPDQITQAVLRLLGAKKGS